MVLVVYVDDVLLFGPDENEMNKVLSELKIAGFELKTEKHGKDASYDFLGINISLELGLIKKFLDTVGMMDCKPYPTPCTVQPLGSDANGKRHFESWDYASAVGMLMYLAGNAYPEIQYSVHQCARFAHAPRHSHAVAVKRIAHYLQGVLNDKQGLQFKISDKFNLDLYVDADFAGLWTYEDDQDPVCVRSRTGYVVTLGDCPIQFSSKLQTEVATSTLEAEYIALAQAMREFVPMRRAYTELCLTFGFAIENDSVIKSKIFEDNNGCISTCTAPKMTHIAVKYHFVRNYFNRAARHPYVLEKIESQKQKADLFTKGFNAEKFTTLRKLLCGW